MNKGSEYLVRMTEGNFLPQSLKDSKNSQRKTK